MNMKNQLWGHLAAFAAVCVWATTFISNKLLLVTFSPLDIMFYRLILAVVALFIFSPPHLNLSRLDRISFKDELKPMAAGLCGVTLYYIFQNISLKYTLAANVGVLISSAPLFTALLNRAIYGDILKRNFFFGFSAAMLGIILITYNGSYVLKLNPLGDLLAILAALTWAFYNVVIKKDDSPQGDVLVFTRKLFFYGFIFMLPVLPFFEFHFGIERLVSIPNLLNLAFLGIGASAICYAVWNYAINIIGSVKTSVYVFLIPVVTIIESALFLHEAITMVSGVGMLLILTGMALSEQEIIR